jgi:hypothetical protein
MIYRKQCNHATAGLVTEPGCITQARESIGLDYFFGTKTAQIAEISPRCRILNVIVYGIPKKLRDISGVLIREDCRWNHKCKTARFGLMITLVETCQDPEVNMWPGKVKISCLGLFKRIKNRSVNLVISCQWEEEGSLWGVGGPVQQVLSHRLVNLRLLT